MLWAHMHDKVKIAPVMPCYAILKKNIKQGKKEKKERKKPVLWPPLEIFIFIFIHRMSFYCFHSIFNFIQWKNRKMNPLIHINCSVKIVPLPCSITMYGFCFFFLSFSTFYMLVWLIANLSIFAN